MMLSNELFALLVVLGLCLTGIVFWISKLQARISANDTFWEHQSVKIDDRVFKLTNRIYVIEILAKEMSNHLLDKTKTYKIPKRTECFAGGSYTNKREVEDIATIIGGVVIEKETYFIIAFVEQFDKN